MSFIEKEYQLGFRRIAHFRKLLEQFRQHPEQERGIEPRVLHQLVGDQNVDHAPAVTVGPHEILQIERRLTEKFVRTLIFQHQKLAQDATDRLLGNISVLRGQFRGVFADE